ncbi:FAD-binding protein [Rhodococcus aetherivorans]
MLGGCLQNAPPPKEGPGTPGQHRRQRLCERRKRRASGTLRVPHSTRIHAPLYAIHPIPADLGTCGDLVTDEYVRVPGIDDPPISGLYATVNTTATPP